MYYHIISRLGGRRRRPLAENFGGSLRGVVDHMWAKRAQWISVRLIPHYSKHDDNVLQAFSVPAT